MTLKKQIAATALLLAAALALEQFTQTDVRLQNIFFDFVNCSWLINKNLNPLLHLLFYTGIKAMIIALSLLVLGIFMTSFKTDRLKPWRKACVLFLLAATLVPLSLAGTKKYTNVYCPAQLNLYCGDKPYIKVFGKYPPDFDKTAHNRGRCFPAGHASGGFALMALFFCFKKKKAKLLGLAVGLGAGWSMGCYQMFRGEHFLSHTLTTMFGAWLIILLLEAFMRKLARAYPVFLP